MPAHDYRGPIEEVWHNQTRCACRDEVERLRYLLHQARDIIKGDYEYSGNSPKNVGMVLVGQIDRVLPREG